MDTTAGEMPPEAKDEAEAPRALASQAASPGGTPVPIWTLYGLGILSAVVLAASVLVVAIESAGSGGDGVDLHVSTPALAIWLALVIAGGTFVWRRRGRAE